MIKTYLETKKYTKEDNDYLWIKNVDFRNTSFGFYVGNITSNLEYSYDKTTWYDKTEAGGFWVIYLEPGQKVYLRNDAGYLNTNNNRVQNSSIHFERLVVGGPLASLIDYTDMQNVTTIPEYCFAGLFDGQSISDGISSGERWYDASQIDLGNITTVADYGMNGMFSYCPNLVKVPDFSSITSVGDYGMESIFQNCPSVDKVYAPNVAEWDTNSFQNWLYETGVFVQGTKEIHCPTGLVIPTDDYSGIPEGWTRIDY